MLDWPDIICRLGAAMLIGSAIGAYLELNRKPTGIRTLGLVALASAVAVLAVAKDPDADASRVIQGVITGVGFLGTGVILHRGTGGQMVHGFDCGNNLDYCVLGRIVWSRCLAPRGRHCRPYRPPINLRRRSRQAAAGPPL
jgi:MgtC family